MLSFNEISNFPVLPWVDENKKERKKLLTISPQTKLLKCAISVHYRKD